MRVCTKQFIEHVVSFVSSLCLLYMYTDLVPSLAIMHAFTVGPVWWAPARNVRFPIYATYRDLQLNSPYCDMSSLGPFVVNLSVQFVVQKIYTTDPQ